MTRVDLFHIGPQKTGTTWIYQCLRAHPQIVAPPRDSIHFFDMHYDRGDAWYTGHFDKATKGRRFDPTPSYLRSSWAPRRIAAHNPDARIAMCLRHPIERAFSHYWHEKKKGRHEYTFAEVLRNYDLYASWLEPGFYAEHLERYLDHFPREQLFVQRFEDLHERPQSFLCELLAFFGVDVAEARGPVHEKVNAAGPRHTPLGFGLYSVRKAMHLVGFERGVTYLERSAMLSGKSEYVRGVDADLYPRLLEICETEIERLEQLLSIDLASWRRNPAATRAA